MSRRHLFYFILFLVLVAGNVSVYRAIFAPPVLTVYVLDVGRGNAVLIQSPRGETVLVDTGPDASISRNLGAILPVWQRHIDAVILTSTAARSTAGLPAVESRYTIGKLYRLITTEEHLSLNDGVSVDILSSPKNTPILHISYGSTTMTISSSTPMGAYISDGKVIR